MARTLLLRLAVALLAALTAALGGQARADIVRLAVASNFAEPMQTLAEAFSADLRTIRLRDFGYAIQLMIARTLSSKLRSARLSQQITVNQKGGQSQPMLDAPLRSPEEQKLYATCFEGLGVTQDQFTRIVSCFQRFVCF